MLAILLACLAVCLLTYWQIFKQGFFSSFINAVTAIIAVLLAFNYFEPLGGLLARLGLGTLGPRAIAFLAIFIIAYVVLREISDRLIRGNMNFSLVIDRAGAAIAGLIYSLVFVGAVLVGLQMLPIGADFLLFDRFARDRQKFKQESGLFPYADSLVTNFAARASAGPFAGPNSFAQRHPHFLRGLYLNRLAISPGQRNDATPQSLQVLDVWRQGHDGRTFVVQEYEDRGSVSLLVVLDPAAGIDMPMNEELLRVRVRIRAGAGDERGARDGDGKIRLVMGGFRLVGVGDDAVERYPVGVFYEEPVDFAVRQPDGSFELDDSGRRSLRMRTHPGPAAVLMRPDQGMVLDGDAEVTLLFTWPVNAATERLTPAPTFLEFRRSAYGTIGSVAAPGQQG